MLKYLLTTLLIIVVIFSLLFYVLQRRLMYFPDNNKPSLQDHAGIDLKDVVLKTADKLALNSWYIAGANAQKTVLVLHGNGGNIDNRVFMARKFAKAGLGVLLLEYRGYGANPGSPSEKGFYEDADSALKFLTERGIKPQDIILYGESLGTAVATELAAKTLVACVILQSPFTSMTKLARHHYPWNYLSPWDKYDSWARIKSIKSPLLIIHGKLDTIVPYSEGLQLFDAANEPKKMLTLEGHNHNDLWSGVHFFEDVMKFIQEECHAP